MRQRLRSSLTYANVMATLAVFLILGGGTALGAYVVSSNSQIGPGTVSGHHPPAGKHANIIIGSVNGQDVHNLVFQNLTLKSGWAANCAGGGSPAIAKSVEGVVYFRGEMCRASGTSDHPFDVPASLRPSKIEFIPVDQYGGSTGRIVVFPDGTVTVQKDPVEGGTYIFTSLAGASYALPF